MAQQSAAARADKVKAITSTWLEHAKTSGLVIPSQKPVKRSSVECGISIDYLALLAQSVRAHPLLPTTTRLIVENAINAATADQGCRFIDVIPQEHVGTATAVICHSWNGDFLDMLVTLVDEFNGRWDAHKAYRSQRKTTAQVMAEEQQALEAQEEARKLQEKMNHALAAANARWDEQQGDRNLSTSVSRSLSRTNSNNIKRQTSNIPQCLSLEPWGLPPACSPTEDKPDMISPSGSPLPSSTGAAGFAAAMMRRRPAMPPAACAVDEQGSTGSPASQALTAGPEALASGPQGASPRGGVFGRIQQAAGSLATSAGKPRFNLGDIVDVVTQRAIDQGELQASQTRDLKAVAKRVMLVRRGMGAETALGIRAPSQTMQQLQPGPASPPTVLARSGTLCKRMNQRSLFTSTSTADDTLMPSSQSIYAKAQASADLTRLLRPMDEDQELLDTFLKAQRAAQDKLAAAKATQEQDALREEKKKLLGYYVWIDIFALEQFSQSQRTATDLNAMSRLINVISRTVVVVEDDWGVLKRLWCLYEIWCTIKYKAMLLTLTTASALAAAPTPTTNSASRHIQPRAPWNADSDAHPTDDSQSPLQGPTRTASVSLDGPLPSLDTDAGVLEDDLKSRLQPVPHIDLLAAKATHTHDSTAILSVFHGEVQSPRTQIFSLRQVTNTMQAVLCTARDREALHASLTRGIYHSLALCGRNWRGVLSTGWQELDAAREALKALAEEHLSKEYESARDLQAVSDCDVEMELWQLIRFVSKHMVARHEEPFWVSELNKFAELAHKSFASRFSSSYVDNLLRAAGTFDDMKVLRSYVYGSCHARIKSKREDDGE